jgi:hypothetical protein
MEKENLLELFKEAAKIASNVPEKMQLIAFGRALDFLTKSQGRKTRIKKTEKMGKRSVNKTGKKTKDEQVEKFLAEVDRTKYPIISKLGKVLGRSLLVLKIAADKFKFDGLTPPQIARILTEKFRLRTTRQAVNNALEGAGNFVDRIPFGKANKYRIMQPGEIYLENLIKQKDEKK